MAEMRSYATVDDYFKFIGETPAEAEPADERRMQALIRRASSAVDSMLVTAVYSTDDDGYPLNVAVSDALRDATCAQMEWFEEQGDASGAAGAFESGSLLSASFSRGNGGGKGSTGQRARLAPEALQILRNAGLVTVGIGHR